MHITGPETRRCPPEFQDRLTRMFGRNQFGDPHFKIVWGQSQFMRMGNLWRDKHGNERVGYRDRYQCHAMPCWVIMRWHSPSEYGSPRMYYANTYVPVRTRVTAEGGQHFDSPNGFFVGGEYPWRGRYEIVQPLISREFKNGKLEVTHFPISHMLIDKVIPMMIAFQKLSQEQKEAARAAARAAEEAEQTKFIADVLEANMPRYLGPVSYSHQGIRTSLLDRKMHQIQKVWDRMSRHGLRPKFNRGMAQGDRPVVKH